MTNVKRWFGGRVANIAWKVMAAVALLLSIGIGYQQRQMTACQARYNEASNASQQARSLAAEADRQAVDELMRAVATNPRQALIAIRAYNAKRDLADRQREANPVPPPPSETCG